jgi:hypothetical protein
LTDKGGGTLNSLPPKNGRLHQPVSYAKRELVTMNFRRSKISTNDWSHRYAG